MIMDIRKRKIVCVISLITFLRRETPVGSKSLVAVGNNYQGIPTLENAAYEFITDTWGKILVVSLEFAPRDEALAWAKKVVDAPRYKDHKVILLTHSYLAWTGKVIESENLQSDSCQLWKSYLG